MWGRGVLPAALPAPFSATLSPALLVYLCTNVEPQGLLVVGLPAPFVPHSASLSPATATRVLSTPVPISAPPTGLDECLFFISLVSVPLAVRFSVSSGCARRRSGLTYAAILVLESCISNQICNLPFSFFWSHVNADTLVDATRSLQYEEMSIFNKILNVNHQEEVIHKHTFTFRQLFLSSIKVKVNI